MADGSQPSGGCPVAHTDASLSPANMMPPPDQSVHADQQHPLSQQRQQSSIPRSTSAPPPSHQPNDSQTWSYPSEQMYYNAMRKKGWNVNGSDIPATLAIHNAVNEQVWNQILEWESLHASTCRSPKLKKLQALQDKPSPKARFRVLRGTRPPFDRHDWVVDRCGRDVRYIIDFYTGKSVPGKAASMFLDVRPALDSWTSAVDRFVRMPWSRWTNKRK